MITKNLAWSTVLKSSSEQGKTWQNNSHPDDLNRAISGTLIFLRSTGKFCCFTGCDFHSSKKSSFKLIVQQLVSKNTNKWHGKALRAHKKMGYTAWGDSDLCTHWPLGLPGQEVTWAAVPPQVICPLPERGKTVTCFSCGSGGTKWWPCLPHAVAQIPLSL